MMLALFFIFPLVWMIASSLKQEKDIYSQMTSIFAFLPSTNPKDWGIAYQQLFSRFPIFRIYFELGCLCNLTNGRFINC